MTASSQRERALSIAGQLGTLHAHAAVRAGIHSQVLSRLVAEGALHRVARGQYRLPDFPVTQHHGLALVAGAVPDAVVCLLSALSFHHLGTQSPPQIWIALPRSARTPALAWPPLRVSRFGGETLTSGVETHILDGVPVKVFGIAKTVADLFKYRNKVGLDVALEALKEAWTHRRLTMRDMDRYARICGVERVMRPYLEAIVS